MNGTKNTPRLLSLSRGREAARHLGALRPDDRRARSALHDPPDAASGARLGGGSQCLYPVVPGAGEAGPVSAESDKLAAALAYAGRGWAVLPLWWLVEGGCACGDAKCGSPGKHPLGSLVPHGVKDASTGEQRNAIARHPSTMKYLKETLAGIRSSPSPGQGVAAEREKEETRRLLRALGYLE